MGPSPISSSIQTDTYHLDMSGQEHNGPRKWSHLQSVGIEASRSAKRHLSPNHELVDLRPAEVSIARQWRIGSLIIHSGTSVSISMHKQLSLNGDRWRTNIRSIQGTESVIIMSRGLVGLGRETYNLNTTARVSISDPDLGWVQGIQHTG